MKVKRINFPSPRSSKCSSGGVVVISLQVGDCWLWSLIFQIQIYYSVVIVTQEYFTLISLALGFGGNALETQGFGGNSLETQGFEGGAHDKFFWDVCWPTILQTHGIGLTLEFSHCISPIK